MSKRQSSPKSDAQVLAQRELWTLVVTRFRELETDQGFRQADLARLTGASRPQIHSWLNRPKGMTLMAASRLLAAMGMTLEFKLRSLTPSSDLREPGSRRAGILLLAWAPVCWVLTNLAGGLDALACAI